MARQKSPLNLKRDEIRTWFDNCDPKETRVRDAIKRGVKLIWQYQTPQEQTEETTRDHNGVGFGAYDARLAARIVNWRGMLTEKMAFAARKLIRKYAKQLADITLRKES